MAAADDPSQDEVFAILNAVRPPASLPRVPLIEYRKMAGRLPPPSSEQIRAFARFVACAKSWYKHLPFLPPGAAFRFFVDPWAGMDRMRTRDGGIIFGERTRETFRFHYTWMPSAEYRERFGRLAFACESATSLYIPVSCHKDDGTDAKGLLDNNPDRAVIAVPGYGEYQLPQEVLDAGTAWLTGAIHPLTATWGACSAALARSEVPGPWPLESGGPAVLDRLRARCREIEEASRAAPTPEERPALDAVDEELNRLIAPERRRLRGEIVHAVERVVDLLYGSGAWSN
jgi:hypothetical protein